MLVQSPEFLMDERIGNMLIDFVFAFLQAFIILILQYTSNIPLFRLKLLTLNVLWDGANIDQLTKDFLHTLFFYTQTLVINVEHFQISLIQWTH